MPLPRVGPGVALGRAGRYPLTTPVLQHPGMASRGPRVLGGVVLGLFTFLVFLTYITESDLNRDERVTVSRIVSFTAHRPFITRALVPGIISVVSAATPPSIRARAEASVSSLETAFPQATFERGFVYETLVLYGVILASLLGFALSARSLYEALCPEHARWSFLVPFLALYGLPPFFQRAYFYDLPTLFLFTACLAQLARERWRSFLFLFALASANRETAIFILPLFVACYHARRPRAPFVRLLLAQALVFGLTRFLVARLVAGTQGGPVEFHLLDFLQKYALFYSFEAATSWIVLLVLILYRWDDKPPMLKWGLWFLVPLFALYFTVGMPREIRVFYEAYPIVCLLVAHSVMTILCTGPGRGDRDQPARVAP